MKFTDWWRLRYGESSRPDSTYLERDLKQWACLAWIQGFEEGRKRALEERSDTSQGGGSHKCYQRGADGFELSKQLAYGCSFCNGTEGGQQPRA